MSDFLEQDQVVRLRARVTGLREDLDILDDVLDIPILADVAKHRVRRLTATQIREMTLFWLPKPILDHMVKRYVEAESFENANRWAHAAGRTLVTELHQGDCIGSETWS